MARYITTKLDIDVSETFTVDVRLSLDDMKRFFENCDDSEKLEIKSALKISQHDTYKGKTILDQLKIELMKEALEKYTLDELERRLK